MAGYANSLPPNQRRSQHEHLPATHNTTTHTSTGAHLEDQVDPLPKGSCNYRDLHNGPKAPTCGCRRFWLDTSHDGLGMSLDLGDNQAISRSHTQSPWCVCGHHACFHDPTERSNAGSGRVSAHSQGSTAGGAPVYVQLVPSHDGQGQYQLVSVSRPGTAGADVRAVVPGIPTGQEQLGMRSMYGMGSRTADQNLPGASLQPHPEAELMQLNHSGYGMAKTGALGNGSGAQGLGLDFYFGQNAPTYTTTAVNHGTTRHRPGTYTPDQPPRSESEADNGPSRNMSRAFMDHYLASRAGHPTLQTDQLMAQGLVPEGLILSATEVDGTPSLAARSPNPQRFQEESTVLLTRRPHDNSDPSKTGAGHIILPTLPDTLSGYGGSIPDTHCSTPVSSQQPPNHTRNSGPPNVRPAPPQGRQNSDYPNVVASLHSHGNRLEALENASTYHSTVEELQQKFDLFEGRMLEVEGKVEDQGKAITILDDQRPPRSRRIKGIMDNESFTGSVQSNTTSESAYLAAAMERRENQEKFHVIEQRLDKLEDGVGPSFSHPWQIEVILLPWGRDLRGIWFSPNEVPTESVVGQGNDWTQVLGSSVVGTSMRLTSGGPGWSQQDISAWAGHNYNVLFPRACGTKGLVYDRLKSRGLVRNVELRSASAHDIQQTIVAAFGSVYLEMSAPRADNSRQAESSDVSGLIGLDAPLIPLRKVHKSSRLRFLTDAEMVTPALWTADFLASGVMMKATAGQKRLFVTHHDAYLQQSEQLSSSGWTWQRLRELPRVYGPEQSNNHVGEADAKESCWEHNSTLDPPPSVHSSFASSSSYSSAKMRALRSPPSAQSQHSTQLSLRQASQQSHHQQSQSGSSYHSQHAHFTPPSPQRPISQPQPLLPITPVSEFPVPSRPGPHHRHSLSFPVSDPDNAAAHRSPSFKRRVTNFSPAKSTVQTPKRRRISTSPAPGQKSPSQSSEASASEGEEHDAPSAHSRRDRRSPSNATTGALGWGITPRLSREPSHPSSRSQGARTSSADLPMHEDDIEDLGFAVAHEGHAYAARSGKGSRRRVTPSAYATPFSGDVGWGRDEQEQEEEMAVVKQEVRTPSEEDVWEGVDEDAGAGDVGGGVEREEESSEDEDGEYEVDSGGGGSSEEEEDRGDDVMMTSDDEEGYGI